MLYEKNKVTYCSNISENNLIEGHVLKRLSDSLYYKCLGYVKDYDTKEGLDIKKYAVFFGFIVDRDYIKKFFETENNNLVIYELKKEEK